MAGLIEYSAQQIGDLIVGKVAEAALDAFRRRMVERAREILLLELKNDTKAAWQVANEDALFGAVHRFERASIEGAATHNLRLLAKAMRNTLLAGDLTTDRFNVFADMLAGLTRSECWLLGRTHSICTNARKVHGSTSSGPGCEAFWTELAAACVPNVYPTARHLTTALLAMQRTGLVMSVGSMDHLNIAYETSPLMNDLVEIIDARDFESVAADRRRDSADATCRPHGSTGSP